ncbi:Armadillo-like helical domain containing protein [Gracilaria domingensis]|nr:Armadillo-like helical domain containing protein [Gracilaria domingensis]
MEIMRAHSPRTGIQTRRCLTFANLAYRNRSNKEAGFLAIRNFTNRSYAGEQETSAASSAVEVLLPALERYAGSETMQDNELIAVTDIASCSPYGMERLRAADGIQVLVSSLKHNLHSVKLAEVGMSLTRVVAENDRNKELFGQAGGIQAMTAVMNTHHGHLAFSVKGCAAVRHLAFRRKNCEIMGSCGIIRTIVCVMNECTTASPDGVCYFFKASCNIKFDSLASKNYAGRCEAVEATLRIMADTSYREDGISQNQRNTVKHRGILIIRGAGRRHGEALAGVADHSVASVVNMVRKRGFASQLQESSGDVSQSVRKLRKAHEGTPRVETQVSNLVHALERDIRSVSSVGSTELRDWRTKSSNTFAEDHLENSADVTLFLVCGPDDATNVELDAIDRNAFMKAAVEATNLLLKVAGRGLAHALLNWRNGLPNARGRVNRDAVHARGYAPARRGAAAGPALAQRAPLR